MLQATGSSPVDHDDVAFQIEVQIVEPEVAVHNREGTPGEADATLIAKFASRQPEALASARRAGSYVREVAFYPRARLYADGESREAQAA